MPDAPDHVHHWYVDTPDGRTNVWATCDCGENRMFRASVSDAEFMREGWNNMHSQRGATFSQPTNIRMPEEVVWDGLESLR